MKIKTTMVAAAMLASGQLLVPASVSAQTYHDQGHDREYRGQGGEYRHHHKCGGGNGAVGTVAGGVGGALVGNAVGGGTLGTVAGGVGGALLGRHLDKKHTEHRNDC